MVEGIGGGGPSTGSGWFMDLKKDFLEIHFFYGRGLPENKKYEYTPVQRGK
jgi:hypothetical protein